MSDWNYIVGEDLFNQDFLLFDRGTNKQFDATLFNTVDMTIVKSDLTAVTPAIANVAMTFVTKNPARVRYAVTVSPAIVPQTVGSYLATIKLVVTASTVRKTFELDLRVFRG